MRNLLILGMLLVAASMAGWFQIKRKGDRTTIEIDRSEIREDARRAIDRGREFLDERDQRYAEQQEWEQQTPLEQVATQLAPWWDGTQWQFYENPNQNQQNPYQNQPQQVQPNGQFDPYVEQPYYGPVTR